MQPWPSTSRDSWGLRPPDRSQACALGTPSPELPLEPAPESSGELGRGSKSAEESSGELQGAPRSPRRAPGGSAELQ
eukprot:9977412-Alexandrium_andersonii.AAC.1